MSNRIREAVAWASISLVPAGLTGIAIEANTNDVAQAKAYTAKACVEEYVLDDGLINSDIIVCMGDGRIPGGTSINTEDFETGMPTESMDSYIQSQKEEAESIESVRVVAWALALGSIKFAVLSRLLRKREELPFDPDPAKEPLPIDGLADYSAAAGAEVISLALLSQIAEADTPPERHAA